jgi:hypothetical protein
MEDDSDFDIDKVLFGKSNSKKEEQKIEKKPFTKTKNKIKKIKNPVDFSSQKEKISFSTNIQEKDTPNQEKDMSNQEKDMSNQEKDTPNQEKDMSNQEKDMSNQENDISKIEEMLSSKDKVKQELKKESEKFDDLQSVLSKENKIATELKRQIIKCDDGQVLIKCDSSNNHDVFLSIIKCVLEHGKKPVAILSSMNYKTARKLIENSDIETEKIALIDTITKNILDIEEEKGVVFVDSLRNLTQLQIKLIKFIEKENDLVFVFDSINVLELYHKETILFKFIYSLTKLLHKNKINGYYILGKKSLAPKISQFFDNVVEIKKVE